MFGTKLTFQGREIFGLTSSEVLERLKENEGNFCAFSSGRIAQPSFP